MLSFVLVFSCLLDCCFCFDCCCYYCCCTPQENSKLRKITFSPEGDPVGRTFALDKLESSSNLMEAESGNPSKHNCSGEQGEQKFAYSNVAPNRKKLSSWNAVSGRP